VMRTGTKSLSSVTCCVLVGCLLVTGASCSGTTGEHEPSGQVGGSGSGGAAATGATTGTGGNATGGSATGGSATGGSATGGTATSGTGGTAASGTGGIAATGGAGNGGSLGTGGGASTGGAVTTGGITNSGGAHATGGKAGTGGTTATGGGTSGVGGTAVNATGGLPSTGGRTGVTGTGGRTGVGGQTAGTTGTGGGGTAGASSTACASPLPPITDYTVLAGPFATTTENNTGPDAKCVIYRPKTLGENGFLHAPIVFGPGIGMQASQLSGLLLSFASHGYVVIGTGVLNGGPNDPANKAAMQNALDWMLQQNDKAGTYQGKLATKCAISMGYSVGGTAAVELGGHAAVATTVSIHGHVASSAMHGPLLQTSGDKDTVGRPMQQQTFDKSQVATAFGTVSGADHGYIQSNNGGVERPAIIAWMRYWINGDTGARSYFWGTNCVLCQSPWMDYKTKNWPP
jgi:dienelactone hydrolase